MLSETALPMWQNWQRMQGWQPNDARLLSFSGAENETHVHYRYEYGGVIYASIRSSNKISAHRRSSLWDMRKRWQQAQADGSSELGFLEFFQQHYAESEKPGLDNTTPVDWQSRKGWEDARVTKLMRVFYCPE